jgi:hypothetical protein
MAKQQRKKISASDASIGEPGTDTVYKIVDVVGVSTESWGRRRPQCGRNSSGLAARPARRRSDENGHESGKREGSGVSYARFALLQVRRVILLVRAYSEAALRRFGKPFC